MRIVAATRTVAALVVATAGLGSGCSVRRVPLKDPTATQSPTTTQPYDFQAEAASPPPPAVEAVPTTASEPQPTLEVPAPVALGSDAVVFQDLPSPPPPAASSSSPPAASSGTAYRVQVFASGDLEAAERVRRDVQDRLGLAAVVVHQAPYYRVRVGDCPTSEDCRELQERLRAAGFDSVWIVADSVAP